MPTQAEAARQAQEDAMARQAMMQASAQRQNSQARQDMLGARRGNEDAQVRAAQIQADAQLRAAEIMANREAAANKSLAERQLANTEAAKGMTEAQRAELDMRKNDPRAALGEVIAKQLRAEAGMEDPQSGGAKTAPQRSPAATDVTKGRDQQPASGSPEFLPWYQARYGPGAVPSGYAGSDANSAEQLAQRVSAARGGEAQDGYSSDASPWTSGASMVGPNGQRIQVSKPYQRGASPADVRAQMMPQAPFRVTPPSYEMGEDGPMGTPGMVTSAPPMATAAPPPAPAAPMPAPTAAPVPVPAPAGKPKKTLGERYLDKELGLPADEQEAMDLKQRTLAAAEAGDRDAQAMADQQGWQYVKRKVRAANVETDPVIQQGMSSLAEQAKKRGDWFLFNQDIKHAKASGNADAMLMQVYNQMIDMGVPKEDAKKRLQAELVKLNMANDIQWGLPEGIQKDR